MRPCPDDVSIGSAVFAQLTVVVKRYKDHGTSVTMSRILLILHDDASMPGRHCCAVSDSALDTSLGDCVATASSLGCQPSTDSSVTSTGHIRWSGVRCRRSVDVQLTAVAFTRLFLQRFCCWPSSQNISLLGVLMCLQCFDAVGWAAGRASGL